MALFWDFLCPFTSSVESLNARTAHLLALSYVYIDNQKQEEQEQVPIHNRAGIIDNRKDIN